MKAAGLSEETIDQVATLTEPKLITIKDASEKFGIPISTIHHWRQKGHLTDRGGIRHPGTGGRKVLVDEADIVYLIDNPPKPGRPKTLGDYLVSPP